MLAPMQQPTIGMGAGSRTLYMGRVSITYIIVQTLNVNSIDHEYHGDVFNIEPTQQQISYANMMTICGLIGKKK